MYRNIGEYYIRNGKRIPSNEFELIHSELKIIYEVIRVINKKPLFLEDHLIRLESSLKASQMPSCVKDVKESIYALIEMHPDFEKNIKIDVTVDGYRVYFMESFYPEKTLYQKGVSVITANIVRDNPNVKRLNMDYKKSIEKIKGNLAKEFQAVFKKTLEDGGYEVVDQAAEDVLLVRPAIINLDVNAPDTMNASRSRSFTSTAGEMTLYIEIYDSVTGDLIAKALDRRMDTSRNGFYTWTNSVTNSAAAKRILGGWASILLDALNEAKQQ